MIHRATMKRHITSSSRLCMCVLFMVLLSETITNALVKLPANKTIPAIIVFGDSIVDAGNNDDITTTLARCNYPPYGIDFDGGIPTGRFSNGKVPTDFIAEELGIKLSVPAYRDPALKPEDLLTGVTFASGGAGYVPFTSQLSGGISLSQQLKLFEEYIEKLNEMVGEERTKFIIQNSLFMVICGSNDIANTYFALPSVQRQYNVDSFTTLMADKAQSFAQKLHEYGARRIQVFGVPPLGCVPSQRTVAGGPTRSCVGRFNDATKLYNAKLSANLDSLSRNLRENTLIYIDIYDSLLEIILDPQQYGKYFYPFFPAGFQVVDRGCCGTGLIEVAVLCNNFTADICPNRHDYVFWDSFHPTEKTNKTCFQQRATTKRHNIVHRINNFSSSPSPSSWRQFPFFLFLVLLFEMTTQALFNVHTNKTTSEMIMFGDSLVDAYYKEIIFRWRENTETVGSSNALTNTCFGLHSVQRQYDVASFNTHMAEKI
ncbi:hypothetical protein F2Q69_00051686 [Brassica cretica]|uniref:Uncharacterized protein n=1 Tax=Brassica cretica TaxID=69181 RepID=A0A8S9PRG1_BRACR|nr:hypothetical protein F2Q69_00051686 [Brassica cretica]